MKIERHYPYEAAQHFHSEKWKVKRSVAKGWGLVARRDLKRGESVLVAGVDTLTHFRDEHHTFTVEPETPGVRPSGVHAWMDAPAMLLNHGCVPTLTLSPAPLPGSLLFRARHDIAKGEELTWHYACTEAYDTGIEWCRCGHCGGAAWRGYLRLPPFIQKQIRENYGAAQWIWDREAAAKAAHSCPILPKAARSCRADS